MAGKKSDKTNDAADTTPEAEAVTVSTPETPAADAPETVDAEIVDDEAQAVTTEPAVDAGTAHEEPVAADAATEEKAEEKKGGGGGFIMGLVVLLAVLAAALYLFRDDIFGGADRSPDVDRTSGVVVTDAPEGTDVRKPIKADDRQTEVDGETLTLRERAARAERERDAEQGAAVAEAGTDDAPATPANDAAVVASGVTVAAVDQEEDTNRSALRAAAADRAAARREANEAASAADADSQEAADERAGDTDALGFVSADDEGAMAEAVRAARAEQARIAAEDAARAAERERRADRAQTAAEPQEEADDAPEPAAPAQTARSDDPNAMLGFTRDPSPANEDAGTTASTDDAVVAEQPQRRAQTTSAPRPTGRIRALDDDENSVTPDDANTAQTDEPQPVRPRPPVIASGNIPSAVTTDEELEARLNAVEEDLRDALRTDLRADVREDVLAAANQRIEQAIAQTEGEVAQLRAAMTEQDARSDRRIAQLQDRLEVLQSRDATANTRGVLILALSNLRGELDAGRPFERQLDDVERLAPNVTSLRGARRFSADGLPTDADLRARFRDAAREAATLEARAGSDGFFGKMMANIKGLFSVREIGEVEGETTSAIISRAEAALTRGEVAGAVRELKALEGPAADAFDPFIDTAEAKATTRTVIERLERAVLDADQPAQGR